MTTEQRMASAAAEIKAIVEQAQADIARAWTRFTAGMALDTLEQSDYARGRADAAKALRLAAAREAAAGNTPGWLRAGYIATADDARTWLVDWAADIAEHGPTQEET